ncbi:kinase-like domain-containing protein [Phlebopus sp. FC_14]|nr:kinase-like domain-containing protein [Phlebopus sp. FC_14]
MKFSAIKGAFTRLFKSSKGQHSPRGEASSVPGPSNTTNAGSTETPDIPGSWPSATGNQSSLASRSNSTARRATILSDISEERSAYSTASGHEDHHQELEQATAEVRLHLNAGASHQQSLPYDAPEEDASPRCESGEQSSSDKVPAESSSDPCNATAPSAPQLLAVDRLQTPARQQPQLASTSTPALTVGGDTILSTVPATPVDQQDNRSQVLRRKHREASLRAKAQTQTSSDSLDEHPSSTFANAPGSPSSSHFLSAVEALRTDSQSLPSIRGSSADQSVSRHARSSGESQRDIGPSAVAVVEEDNAIAVVPPGLVHQYPTPSPLPIFSNDGQHLNVANGAGQQHRGGEGRSDLHAGAAAVAPVLQNLAPFPAVTPRNANSEGRVHVSNGQGNAVPRLRLAGHPPMLGSPAFIPTPYRIPPPIRPSRAANCRLFETGFDYAADPFAATRLPPRRWQAGDFLRHRDHTFKIHREIGSGSYGFVWYAKDKDDREVAIKVINKRMLLSTFAEERGQGVYTLDEDFPRKMVITEYLALKRLTEQKARQSTPLLNAFTDSSNVYFVMRHYACSLREYLKCVGRLTSFQKRLFTAELVSAVSELHGMRIVHRDIKPENIFLTPSGHLTLGDFGISDVFPIATSMDITTQCVGTPTYMAPELSCNPGQMRLGQYKTDIYSLAVTILEIFIGTGERWYDILAKKPRKRMNEDPKFWSPLFLLSYIDDGDALELVYKMLQPKPEDRPEWKVIFACPYLTVLNREEVAARQTNSGTVPCASRKTDCDVSSTLDSFYNKCGQWKLHELGNYMARLAGAGRGPDAPEVNSGIDFECTPDVRNEPTHGVSCFRGGCEHDYSRVPSR